jgi:hypothetical protein
MWGHKKLFNDYCGQIDKGMPRGNVGGEPQNDTDYDKMHDYATKLNELADAAKTKLNKLEESDSASSSGPAEMNETSSSETPMNNWESLKQYFTTALAEEPQIEQKEKAQPTDDAQSRRLAEDDVHTHEILAAGALFILSFYVFNRAYRYWTKSGAEREL